MYRLLESGLPEQPVFPTDLKGLGYFINEKDEIRNVKNPREYFRYYLTENIRVNEFHCEAMEEAIRNIVLERLENLGLEKIRLPFGAKATDRHVPILMSSNIKTKKRILVLFHDDRQDLGIFSHRIIRSTGGINKGSAINLVKYLKSLSSSTETDNSSGILLANLGQLRWWCRGKRAVGRNTWRTLPSKSLVEPRHHFNSKLNSIPENTNTLQHIEYIFNKVITKMTHPNAKLDIIGFSNGADELCNFFGFKKNWKLWKPRISAFAAVGCYYSPRLIDNQDFKDWLKKRGRSYILSNDAYGKHCNIYLRGSSEYSPERISPLGCPTFSVGERNYREKLLPKGYELILNWFEEVAKDPNYSNPYFAHF